MALTLLAGPANAGKVALLLERYRDAIAREPFLIVPNRSDVDRVERELLASSGALLGGQIGTFDDLFRRHARDGGEHRPVATDAQRALIVRRALSHARLNGWTRSARYAGFADALSSTLGELESGLVEPAELEGDLAGLYGEYRAELDRLGLWDRDLQRRAAAERVGGELAAWEGRPVFAYGFEDLTGAQWALLEALAGRADVTVSLPYEPGRPAFASLERTAADLSEPASSGIGHRSRPRSAPSACPTRSRGRSDSTRPSSGAPCCRCSGLPGRAAGAVSCTVSSARPIRASPERASTGSRAGSGAAPSRRASAPRRKRCGSGTATRCRRSSSSARLRRRSPLCSTLLASCSVPPTDSSRPRSARNRARICGRSRPSIGWSASSRAGSRSAGR